LLDDLPYCVGRIASFIGAEGAEREEAAVSRSTFAYMKERGDLFDERLSKIARNEACGLPKDAGMGASKVRAGKAGGGGGLSEELRGMIDDGWRDVMGDVAGSYAELREMVNEERGWGRK
jgi:hypothetical protein